MITILFVPDLGVLAELALENADRARPAHIVGQEHIGVHPHVFAGRHVRLAAGAREHFFGQSHKEGICHRRAGAQMDFGPPNRRLARVKTALTLLAERVLIRRESICKPCSYI